MTIINTSPDRIIQLGYEGEDRVTVLRFRYGADWLENGEGIFNIRVRRHGEHTAYNAALVADDTENHCLLMTVTNVELSVKGSGEMQVVYSGADFVKKSPIYSYNVSRAVDEAVDPPAQDVYTEIIESLSDLQTDIRQIDSDVADLSELTTAKIGDLTELTTEAKTDLVSAINEVNEHGGGGSVAVDEALSTTSTNPVQNKVLTARINGLDSDVGTLRTSVQSKADTQTVSALADAVQDLDGDVQGLQTAVQGKANTSTVTALSNRVTAVEDGKATHDEVDTVQDNLNLLGQVAQQYMEQTSTTLSGLQTSKADKSYVDTALAGKASTATATASSDGLMSAQDKSKLDAADIAISTLTTEMASNAFSREAKLALLELLKYVAWVDDDGAEHISDLERSFGFSTVEVEATYTQTHAVYVGMPLSHLKLDLVVARIYNSGVTEVIDPADYTLSGSLILGTRTITVDVDGVTDTFTVDVSASPTKLYDWDFSSSLTDSVAGQTAVLTGAVMGDDGIVYAARGDSTTLGHVLGYDRSVEIDVLSFDFKGDPNENIRFAMWGGWGGEQGLIKRHNSSGGSNPGWSSYMERAWTSAPFIPGTSDEVINCINRKTVGIYIDASGYISMYLNGVLQGTSSNYAKEATLTGTDFQIGSTDQRVAYGGQMYDANISGVRIFEGNIYA